MNPEPIAPGLITAHHRSGRCQAEPRAALGDHPLDLTPVPARHAPQPRLHTEPRRHSKLPFLLAQLKRHIYRRAAYTHLRAGRCDHHSLLLASNTLRSLIARPAHSLFVVKS